MDYKIHLNGVVSDDQKGFKCGIDIVVENGGSFADVGNAINEAVNAMASKVKDRGTETEQKS